MSIKIRNWKLGLLTLFCFSLLFSLGCWQVSRAKQKTMLLHHFAQRQQHSSLTSQALHQPNDYRFFRLNLVGRFDNKHTLLLDNKIFHGKIGYEVYTPFLANGLDQPILIDRGFIPQGNSRKILPNINAINGEIALQGMLNSPPAYVAFGEIMEHAPISFPLRVEFINLTTLSKLLSVQLFSYVLLLEPNSKQAYAIEWQAVTITPERHIAYALQWFALAITLLILFVVLNRDSKNKNGS